MNFAENALKYKDNRYYNFIIYIVCCETHQNQLCFICSTKLLKVRSNFAILFCIYESISYTKRFFFYFHLQIYFICPLKIINMQFERFDFARKSTGDANIINKYLIWINQIKQIAKEQIRQRAFSFFNYTYFAHSKSISFIYTFVRIWKTGGVVVKQILISRFSALAGWMFIKTSASKLLWLLPTIKCIIKPCVRVY